MALNMTNFTIDSIIPLVDLEEEDGDDEPVYIGFIGMKMLRMHGLIQN